MTSVDHLIKVIVIGNSAVGKTALVKRYAQNCFEDKYDSTIGIDFASRNIYINDINVKVQIWDTAGQERFHSITKSYMRGVQGAIFVFDVCNMQSFLDIDKWNNDIDMTEGNNNTKKLLVGNKKDLVEHRVVPRKEAEEYAKNYGMLYVELSAKDGGKEITEAFNTMVDKVLQTAIPPKIHKMNIIEPESNDVGCGRSCCFN